MMNYDDVPVMLSASRRSSKKIRSIYIEEPDFTVEGDLMSQEILVYRKPGQYHIDAERYVQENIIEKVTVNKQEPLKQELNTFITCVKNNTEFPVTPQQATHNLEICEYIRNYLETGGC
jgi:predicted dehydrogenase